MSIFSLVLHDMHLPHALNRGVHHLGRSETSRRRPRPRRASWLARLISWAFFSCDRMGSCAFQRDKSRNGACFRSTGGLSMQPDRLHGKRRIDGRRQRHGNAMTSVAHG